MASNPAIASRLQPQALVDRVAELGPIGRSGASRAVFRRTNMLMKYILVCSAAFLLLMAGDPVIGLAQAAKVGGYAPASVTSKEVVAAADFAIKAQAKAMQQKQEAEAPKLELVTILGAEEQVVAGMNYRLQLKVKLNGQEKTATATVWWQAWRKPAPYELTAWNWK